MPCKAFLWSPPTSHPPCAPSHSSVSGPCSHPDPLPLLSAHPPPNPLHVAPLGLAADIRLPTTAHLPDPLPPQLPRSQPQRLDELFQLPPLLLQQLPQDSSYLLQKTHQQGRLQMLACHQHPLQKLMEWSTLHLLIHLFPVYRVMAILQPLKLMQLSRQQWQGPCEVRPSISFCAAMAPQPAMGRHQQLASSPQGCLKQVLRHPQPAQLQRALLRSLRQTPVWLRTCPQLLSHRHRLPLVLGHHRHHNRKRQHRSSRHPLQC